MPLTFRFAEPTAEQKRLLQRKWLRTTILLLIRSSFSSALRITLLVLVFLCVFASLNGFRFRYPATVIFPLAFLYAFVTGGIRGWLINRTISRRTPVAEQHGEWEEMTLLPGGFEIRIFPDGAHSFTPWSRWTQCRQYGDCLVLSDAAGLFFDLPPLTLLPEEQRKLFADTVRASVGKSGELLPAPTPDEAAVSYPYSATTKQQREALRDSFLAPGVFSLVFTCAAFVWVVLTCATVLYFGFSCGPIFLILLVVGVLVLIYSLHRRYHPKGLRKSSVNIRRRLLLSEARVQHESEDGAWCVVPLRLCKRTEEQEHSLVLRFDSGSMRIDLPTESLPLLPPPVPQKEHTLRIVLLTSLLSALSFVIVLIAYVLFVTVNLFFSGEEKIDGHPIYCCGDWQEADNNLLSREQHLKEHGFGEDARIRGSFIYLPDPPDCTNFYTFMTIESAGKTYMLWQDDTEDGTRHCSGLKRYPDKTSEKY